jgi:hypothetical protein
MGLSHLPGKSNLGAIRKLLKILRLTGRRNWRSSPLANAVQNPVGWDCVLDGLSLYCRHSSRGPSGYAVLREMNYLFFEGPVVLKRFLLIFNDLIFDSRVDRGMPSFEAAPEGPYT